jgi:hypothetical protein
MGKQFDELSKQLAKGVSRRQLLKGGLAGLVASAVASFIPGRRGLGASADGVNTRVLHCCQIYCGELSMNSTRPNFGHCVQTCYSQSTSGFYGPCSNCVSVNSASLCLPQ